MEWLFDTYVSKTSFSESIENVLTYVYQLYNILTVEQCALGLACFFIVLLWHHARRSEYFGSESELNRMKTVSEDNENEGVNLCVKTVSLTSENALPKTSNTKVCVEEQSFYLNYEDNEIHKGWKKSSHNRKNAEENCENGMKTSDEDISNITKNNDGAEICKVTDQILNNDAEPDLDKRHTNFSLTEIDDWGEENDIVEELGNNFQLSEFMNETESNNIIFNKLKKYFTGTDLPKETSLNSLSLNPLCTTLLDTFNYQKDIFTKNMKVITLVIDSKHNTQFSRLTKKYKELMQNLNRKIKIYRDKLVERHNILQEEASSVSQKKLDVFLNNLKYSLDNEFLLLQSNFVDYYNKIVKNCKTLKMYSQITFSFYKKKFYDNLGQMYNKVYNQYPHEKLKLAEEYTKLEISFKNEMNIRKNLIKIKLDQSYPALNSKFNDFLEKLNNCYQETLLELQKLDKL